jgi:hypothetical protein
MGWRPRASPVPLWILTSDLRCRPQFVEVCPAGPLLVAGAQLAPGLRIQTIYDAARARLKVIILGDIAATADVLRTIDEVLGSENDMVGGGPWNGDHHE